MSLQLIPDVLSRDLAEQAKCFQAQQKGGKLRRLLESGQEIEALERCYRRIETSFHQLQVCNGFGQIAMSTDQTPGRCSHKDMENCRRSFKGMIAITCLRCDPLTVLIIPRSHDSTQ